MKKELKLLLLDYKLSPDNIDLQKSVIIESESILVSIIKHFKKFYVFLDFEEILNMGRLFLLDAIKAFVFYCPFCAKIALNEKAFRLHLAKFHPGNGSSPPSVSIDKFVCYYIGRKIQQHLDKEKKFKSRLTEIKDVDDDLLVVNDDKVNKVIINDLFNKIIPDLTKRQKIIIKGLANGELQKEVAKRVKRKEGLKSLGSARVMVSRELKELKTKYESGELL